MRRLPPTLYPTARQAVPQRAGDNEQGFCHLVACISDQLRAYRAGSAIATVVAVSHGKNHNALVIAITKRTVHARENAKARLRLNKRRPDNLAALDATTGAATAFNANPDDEVLALAVSGSTVYAGGYFDSIGGRHRSRLAAASRRSTPAPAP